MDLTSGFRIGRVHGIDIRVHWSWLLVFGLLSWSLSQGLFGDLFTSRSEGERWAVGVVTALLFFASVLLHELAHAFVAQRYSMEVPSITLFVFGGVSNLGSEMKTAGQEFRVAIAGPLMSWAVAIAFGALWLLTRPAEISAVFGYLAWINAVLGVFNLLPGFPLDGGRVLRSIVWASTKDLLRATRVASRVGVLIAYAMIAVGLLFIVAFGLFGGLWYVLIGLFLKSASEGSYASMLAETALRDVDAAAVMRPAPAPLHAVLSLQRLVDERLLESGERTYLVEREGTVIGLITAADVASVPRARWGETPVEATMVPAERVITVAPETGLIAALRLMQQHDIHQLPVLEHDRVVGMLTRGDVLRRIEVRSIFGDGGERRPERDG